MIEHTIVTWDCSFRNFFHLLPSLAQTDQGLSRLEVIFVEQRERKTAHEFAKREDCQPIESVVEALAGRLRVRVIHMDDEGPYHPGRLLNAGIREARGAIVSTMDADILVPPDFLAILTAMHARGDRVITMPRCEAAFPCGTTVDDWKNQIIDYELVRNCAVNAYAPVPRVVTNKAPLLSAKAAHWEAIGGYDEHLIFGTAYTLFGRDISRRFELFLGAVETPLPKFCVHPWHPTEVDRKDERIQILYKAQQMLIDWSVANDEPDVRERQGHADAIHKANRRAIDEAIGLAERKQSEHIGGGP